MSLTTLKPRHDHTNGLDLTESDFVSFETRWMAQVVNFSAICGVISFLGVFGNLVNIMVFVRQRFKDSVNISLLGLAIADLLSLIISLWHSICLNPLFESAPHPFIVSDVSYLSAAVPHVCFNKITSFITAYITLERCLCITQPLKVKAMFTPTKTITIIVSIYLVIIGLYVPLYFVNHLEWKFSAALNRTVLTHVITDNRELVETVCFVIHSVAGSIISLATVIVCTVILIIKLNQKTKWRQTASVQAASKAENVLLKDRKVVKMVTFIAIIFIICLIPHTIIMFFMALEPQFSYGGQYENTYYVIWSFAFVLETINSSANIFVYFNMSSKFKRTFYEIFCSCAEESQNQ